MNKRKMKIYTIGGFSEVGKNMTAVELKDDVIIFDCGVFLPPIVELEETEKVYTEKRLRGISIRQELTEEWNKRGVEKTRQ